MNITLTGFMGTGKTAVGKRLAKRLGWRFVDVDELIEACSKLSVARIFQKHGESVFRRLERRCISQVVRGKQQVIATGGGAFIDSHNRAQLRVSGPVICLNARPQVILSRIGNKLSERPLLADSPNPLAKIRALLSHRAHDYAQADATIDTSNLTVDEVVDRIDAILSPCLCKSWDYFLSHVDVLSQRYGGKYVAVADKTIIASGQTQLEAFKKAKARLTEHRELGIYYIPLAEEALTAF